MSVTQQKLEISCSRNFTGWLAEQRASLAFTTYQAGKLFLIGLRSDGRLSVAERSFNRCLGLWSDGQTMWMSSLYQLWRFENTLTEGEEYQGYDRLYVPMLAHTTGDLDAHDLAIDAEGRVLFVNTLFSCIAAPSPRHHFVPLWRPRFVTKLAPEDRCHLNGLAMRDGRPWIASAVAESDVSDGWREHRRSGGVLIDIRSDEIVASGLSMPHSPRFYRGRLWVLDSGSGRFGYVDPRDGAFEPLTFCPGYLRGMAFSGDYAVLGLSNSRDNRTFQGLILDEELTARNAEPRCGLQIVDIRTGDVLHWLRLEGVVRELYDVVLLPGVRRPMAFGFKSDEICRHVSIGQ